MASYHDFPAVRKVSGSVRLLLTTSIEAYIFFLFFIKIESLFVRLRQLKFFSFPLPIFPTFKTKQNIYNINVVTSHYLQGPGQREHEAQVWLMHVFFLSFLSLFCMYLPKILLNDIIKIQIMIMLEISFFLLCMIVQGKQIISVKMDT